MESPCIKKCNLDNNNICQGCHRTLKQIVNWIYLSDKERTDTINNLKNNPK
jgi:predicted Fe-S protein YdhL (DUF1289 family)